MKLEKILSVSKEGGFAVIKIDYLNENGRVYESTGFLLEKHQAMKIIKDLCDVFEINKVKTLGELT